MNNGHLEPEDAGGKFRATNWRDGTYFILHKVWDNGGMVSGWRNGSEYVSYCQRQDYGGLDWEEVKAPSDDMTIAGSPPRSANSDGHKSLAMPTYKVLKDLPRFKAGSIIRGLISINYERHVNMLPQAFIELVTNYPEFFEEIKEPSDEEIVAQWLSAITPIYGNLNRITIDWLIAAKALIAKGFKAEWVKECEHEWAKYGADFREYTNEKCIKCGVKK